jgi:hypothetical protein
MLRSTLFGVHNSDPTKTAMTITRNMMAHPEKPEKIEKDFWGLALGLLYFVIQIEWKGLEGEPRRFIV